MCEQKALWEGGRETAGGHRRHQKVNESSKRKNGRRAPSLGRKNRAVELGESSGPPCPMRMGRKHRTGGPQTRVRLEREFMDNSWNNLRSQTDNRWGTGSQQTKTGASSSGMDRAYSQGELNVKRDYPRERGYIETGGEK